MKKTTFHSSCLPGYAWAAGVKYTYYKGERNMTQLDLIRQVDRHQVRILLLSVLMLPSALHVKELAVKLKEQGVKLVVGGAPFRFDENLWKEVGADATGKNPAEALGIITKMIAEAQ